MKTLIILIVTLVLSGCQTTKVVPPNLVIEKSEYGEEYHYLKGVKWNSLWISQLATVKSALNYYNSDIDDAWLFGGSGYAFILNLDETISTASPTHFNSEFVLNLYRNLGIDCQYIKANQSIFKFKKLQRQAWKFARDSIDNGYPCIGWNLKRPEFYIISGYNNEGYFYSGPLSVETTGPLKWKEFGDNDGIMFIGSLQPCEPAKNKEVVLEALVFAYHFSTTRAWLKDGYKSGLDAYDLWIKAFETGEIDSSGNAYNAAVCNQSRSEAVKFLIEAKKRLPKIADKEFDEAIKCYKVISYNLGQIALAFPLLNTTPRERDKQIKDVVKIDKAIKNLKNARIAEKEALVIMKKLIDKLAP